MYWLCLSPQQECRLKALEDKSGLSDAGRKKASRQAREVCAITALEAIRHQVEVKARGIFEKLLGASPDTLTPGQMLEICNWTAGLDRAQRQRLDATLSAFREHGSGYREHIESNSEWLAKARNHGVVTANWICPPPKEFAVDGQRYYLEVGTDIFPQVPCAAR